MLKPTPRMGWLFIGGAVLGACDCGSDLSAPLDAATDAAHMDAARVSDAAHDGSDDDATIADGASASIDGDIDASGGWTAGCSSRACDLVDNGCAQDLACYYLPPREGAPPQPACVTAGDNAEGSICTTQQQCAPGLGCDPSHRCRHYCCAPGQRTGCPTDQACLLEFRDADDQSLSVGLCQECDVCDPIDGTGCNPDEACYPASDDGACNLCLTPQVPGNVGAACTTHSHCRAGLGCVALDPPRCLRFCSLSAGTCDDGSTCTAIGYSGAPDLGYCDDA